MDFVVPVAIVIAGVFSLAVVDHVMRIPPGRHVVINTIFIGIHLRTGRHGCLHQRGNRGPLYVG